MEEAFEVRTLGSTARQVTRRVIGDSPKHGIYLLRDTQNNTLTEIIGGLAFAIGVACMEAELTRYVGYFYEVQHPNGVPLYHVRFIDTSVIVTRVS